MSVRWDKQLGAQYKQTRIFLNFDEKLVNAKIIRLIPNYLAKTIENFLENLHKDLKISKSFKDWKKIQKFQNILVKFKKN